MGGDEGDRRKLVSFAKKKNVSDFSLDAHLVYYLYIILEGDIFYFLSTSLLKESPSWVPVPLQAPGPQPFRPTC